MPSTDVFGEKATTICLPSAASIFTSEANAITLDLQFIATSDKSKFIINLFIRYHVSKQYTFEN